MKDNLALDWKKRARKHKSLAADRRILESRCGRYRVVFSHIRYGNEIADCFYAMRAVVDSNDRTCWHIISRHRVKQAALKACQKRHRELHGPRRPCAGSREQSQPRKRCAPRSADKTRHPVKPR